MNKGQSKRHSIVEALTQTAIGFGFGLVTQWVFFPMFGIHISMGQNMQICAIFTTVSVIRGYILRRWFNKWMVRQLGKL